MILPLLGDGRLHLSGIALLAPHLTAENREVLLRRATHQSKREIEELIAEVAPREDVPALMRRLPERKTPPAVALAGASEDAPPTLSEMGRTVAPSLIPSARDGSRCAYVDASGRRCDERHRLEYHHRQPFGFGGGHRPENLRLTCYTHNAYLAEHDYGREAMARFRRSGKWVSGAAAVASAVTAVPSAAGPAEQGARRARAAPSRCRALGSGSRRRGQAPAVGARLPAVVLVGLASRSIDRRPAVAGSASRQPPRRRPLGNREP